MGLTGLDIFKQLPKTNCKDCGQATCLAFAMQIASGKAGLDGCPHVSAAAKEALESASAPPVALVKIGTGDKEVKLGNETVLFRHDKRFEHQAAITITVTDTEDVATKVQAINKLVFDRVGMLFSVNMVAVINASGDAAKFAEAVKVAQENSKFALALCTEDVAAMGKALEVAGSDKPLIYAATAANYEAMAELAKKYDCPLAVKGTDINDLAEVSEKVAALGCKQLILDSGAREVNKMLADQTQIRRLAINKRFRPFGYPTIAIVTNDDPIQAILDASVYISKYAGVVVLNTADPADILPLITLRLNIYTDPQKPIAVEAKLYEIGEPGPDAPVFITTNFSLTYFCVQGDVEASRIAGYVLPVDSDGTSVLTAWASGKLTPDSITELIKKSGIEDKVNHRKLILPGGVAVLSGKLAEISGWEVLVGPYDSGGIPTFLKQRWV